MYYCHGHILFDCFPCGKLTFFFLISKVWYWVNKMSNNRKHRYNLLSGSSPLPAPPHLNPHQIRTHQLFWVSVSMCACRRIRMGSKPLYCSMFSLLKTIPHILPCWLRMCLPHSFLVTILFYGYTITYYLIIYSWAVWLILNFCL